MKITIVNYGMGNIHSLISSISYIAPHAKVQLTNEIECLKNSDMMILPGVGHFKSAMDKLNAFGLIKPLKRLVLDEKKPILGICLGMQLLFKDSSEGGNNPGIGIFNSEVRYIKKGAQKIPHIGFNTVIPAHNSKMFEGIENLDFYFVHSYCANDLGLGKEKISYCNHNEKFVAAIESDNIWATQFHPEKSQINGLKLLKNFILTHGN